MKSYIMAFVRCWMPYSALYLFTLLVLVLSLFFSLAVVQHLFILHHLKTRTKMRCCKMIKIISSLKRGTYIYNFETQVDHKWFYNYIWKQSHITIKIDFVGNHCLLNNNRISEKYITTNLILIIFQLTVMWYRLN